MESSRKVVVDKDEDLKFGIIKYLPLEISQLIFQRLDADVVLAHCLLKEMVFEHQRQEKKKRNVFEPISFPGSNSEGGKHLQ